MVWSDVLPNYLFSSSFDHTIKVWGSTKDTTKVEIDQKYKVNENEDMESIDDESDQSMSGGSDFGSDNNLEDDLSI